MRGKSGNSPTLSSLNFEKKSVNLNTPKVDFIKQIPTFSLSWFSLLPLATAAASPLAKEKREGGLLRLIEYRVSPLPFSRWNPQIGMADMLCVLSSSSSHADSQRR